MKTHICSKTCIWIFLGALSVIVSNWKQHKSPPSGEGDKHVMYPYKREYYAVIKKLNITGNIMNNFKTIKTMYFMISSIWKSRKGQTAVLETYQHGYLGARYRRRGLTAESCEWTFWNDRNILFCDTNGAHMTVHIDKHIKLYVLNQQILLYRNYI